MALSLLTKKTVLAPSSIFTASFLNRLQSSSSSGASKPAAQTTSTEVKPFKFSPFQVSPDNKVDYALARVDDLLNFVRRVSRSRNLDYLMNSQFTLIFLLLL